MFFNKIKIFSTICLFALLLGACASQTGGSFNSSETRRSQTVRMGHIIAIEDAVIENNPSGLGSLGGAVVGGVVGNTMGGGSGRVLTTLGGAIIGGLIGTGIESRVNHRQAIEIVVSIDGTNEKIAVVQELGDAERALRVGDRVRILSGNDGSVRVRGGGTESKN
ncbi:glycine zipper 2TM domain-containing protein [Desulfovibrio litoralis]|uniref:Outer membrane lipoprotein SlyB n=1 Tax=Desulfovibrio litoralis DSM 11393 TaxID=1121455 RepID=A0A1M7RXR3_9BACT|nr:glycine zipper 2TM domain-containing protein [Desulfovibrio litoralis]SHN51099.1 outer membrane lipoprotein SlyB [Desulfovibrio litoralis DSM 11393]